MSKASLGVVAVLSLLAGVAGAKNVAGVEVADSVSVQGARLALNGAGVRSRFFIKIYVGALYLTAPQKNATAAIQTPAPKSVRLHIVYGGLERKQMVDPLKEGIAANSTPAELASLQQRIDDLAALFPQNLKSGDLVSFDLHTDGSTSFKINAEQRGTIPGSDFQSALLKIWLGDHPADGGVKKAMLGG